LAQKSLELVEDLESHLVMPEQWLIARKQRLRNLHEHFGRAVFPAIRVMQGVYPVPVELMADVMAATMDEFEYLDRIYWYYTEDEKKPEFETEIEEVEWEHRKRGILYRFLMYDYLCVINFGRPYKILMAKAVNGSEEALCQLLQVDKTFVNTPWCSERIRERQYRGDWKYFKRIGKAIGTEPVLKERYMFKAVLLVARFWEEQFKSMSYGEIVDFLEKREVLATGTDVEAFRKVLNRAGLKRERYNRKSRTEEEMRTS
jgi:hypothetical protein